MKAFLHRLLAAVYFYLCFAPVPMMIGVWLMGTPVPALIAAAVMLPVAFLIVLLPDRVSRRSKYVTVMSAHGTGDPDPDRDLRSDAKPAKTRRGFPIRVVVMVLVTLVVIALTIWGPFAMIADVWAPYRAVLGVSLGVMMLLSEYNIATGEACGKQAVLTGVIVYMSVGFLASYVLGSESFKVTMYYLAFGYLFVTGFLLNERTLSNGAIAAQSYKPPKSIRTRNRVLLIVFALIVLVVSQFDALRRIVNGAFKAVARAIIKVFAWFTSLFLGEVTLSVTEKTEEEGGGLIADLTQTTGEWSFWEIAGVVLACLFALAILTFLIFKLVKWIKKVIPIIKGWFQKFSSGVNEEYEDVRESLLDFKEARVSFGSTLKKQVERLMKRDPKWAELDPRARVRFLLTLLYRKNAAAVPELSSLTAREAIPRMRGMKKADGFAALYDRARYSAQEIGEREAEDARKEVRV